MHEMALAQSIVDLVCDQAKREPFTEVRTIRLSIGALSTVEPRALEFGFEAAARGTVAEGAALDIDRPPGSAWCADCAKVVTIAAAGEACPSCSGYALLVTAGDEMRVVDLEVV